MPGQRPVAQRTTLAMLAEEAGVSVATASKVLNGHPDVAEATRQRVERLLDHHAYRRRGRRTTDSPLLELVFSGWDNVWAPEMLAGAQQVAAEHGIGLILTDSHADPESPTPWLGGLLARRPLGVLLVSTEPDVLVRRRLDARGIPFAVIDAAGELPPDVPAVGSTNWAGALQATRHLIDIGHRRIAALTGPGWPICSLARQDGYRSALSAAGLHVDEDLVVATEFDSAPARTATHALLTRSERPTAVFAGSDLHALGVLQAAAQLGLRVPEDLSVIGFDDSPLARWTHPRLTTVHQPIREMAAEATRIVLGVGGRTTEHHRVELATHLVIRDSTAEAR